MGHDKVIEPNLALYHQPRILPLEIDNPNHSPVDSNFDGHFLLDFWFRAEGKEVAEWEEIERDEGGFEADEICSQEVL